MQFRALPQTLQVYGGSAFKRSNTVARRFQIYIRSLSYFAMTSGLLMLKKIIHLAAPLQLLIKENLSRTLMKPNLTPSLNLTAGPSPASAELILPLRN